MRIIGRILRMLFAADWKTIEWQIVLQSGVISGVVLLYLGMVGLLGAFIDREVVKDTYTLAQLILALVPFATGYITAQRSLAKNPNETNASVAAILAGLLSVVPTAIVILLSQWYEVDSILVSLNRDWLVMTTFDNRENVLWGITLLAGFNAVASLLGAVFRLLPDKFRNALFRGLLAATLISIFGRTLSLILQDPIKGWLLNRETIEQFPAVVIYVVCLAISFAWTYLGEFVRKGISNLPEWVRLGFLYGLILDAAILLFAKVFVLFVLPEPLASWLSSLLSWSLATWLVMLVGLAIGFTWAIIRNRTPHAVEKIKTNHRTEPANFQQLAVGMLFVLFLFFLPDLAGRSLSLTLFTVGLYILMGLGLNISIGLAGMLDLGYVTSFAVGAYTMAVMSSTSPDGMGAKLTAWLSSEAVGMSPDALWFIPIITNFWFVLIISMLMAMLVGFLFALPILKMRGDYLAIATLGFGQIIGALVGSDWLAPTLGGAQGIQDVPRPFIPIGFEFAPDFRFVLLELANPEQLYYVVLIACALVFYSAMQLANSRTGRQWMAIREDEDVAAAMGIDVPRSKLLAFTLAAAAGGLAGGIFTTQVTTAFPNSFEALVSFNVLALIIVGGLGSNRGIILGALFLVGMPDLLREFSDFRFLLYGILLIVMMLYRPEGLLPSQLAVRELRQDDNTVPAGEA